MILVTGATGTVGRALVDVLVEQGADVIAVTRSPERAGLPAQARVVGGDPSQPETLRDALRGVEAVFVNPAATGEGTGALLALAKELGAQRVVLLSGSAAESGDEGDFLVRYFKGYEQAVELSGLPWTILRPGDFAANALGWAPQIRTTGLVLGAYAESASAPIHERDIAAVAALALQSPDHAGRTYTLTGPISLTQRERVAVIGEAIGSPASFVEVYPAQAKAGLMSHGFAEPIAETMLKYQAAAVDEPAPTTTTVEELLGRPALTFAAWVADHAAAFARPDEGEFPGIFELDVTFREGPKRGDVERHMLNFLPGGRVMLLVPPFPGAGHWSIDGDTLAFSFHEVVLEDGKPAVMVNIACDNAQLDAERNGFKGTATGSIWGPGGEEFTLVATQHVDQQGWRRGADGRPAEAAVGANVGQS
jgi:uncharacterized protein YbjT (DUF2867 family)